jgi:alpha-D-ribose 1-methylphosphonate 5-triphosphate synthase subunit PhnL
MRGSAIVGIFHDEGVRDAVATRVFPVQVYREAA